MELLGLHPADLERGMHNLNDGHRVLKKGCGCYRENKIDIILTLSEGSEYESRNFRLDPGLVEKSKSNGTAGHVSFISLMPKEKSPSLSIMRGSRILGSKTFSSPPLGFSEVEIVDRGVRDGLL